MEKATVKRIVGAHRAVSKKPRFSRGCDKVEVGLDHTYFPHGPPLWKIRENTLSYLYKSKCEEY